MSRLEEIKNEVSKSKGFDSWKVVFVYACRSQVVQISDEATLIYAKEVAQASLEKASQEAQIRKLISVGIGTHYEVIEETITNPDNIVIL